MPKTGTTGLEIVGFAEQPGFIELIRGDSPPDDADEFRQATERFLADSQIKDTTLAADVERRSSDRYVEATFDLGDLWRSIKDYLEPVEFHFGDAETKDVPIEAFWLTLPHVPEAKVTLTRTSGTASELAASVTILGIGGGPTFTSEIVVSDTFEADDPQTVEARVSATFQRVRAQSGDDILAEWMMLVSVDPSRRGFTREPRQPPQPEPTWSKPLDELRFDQSSVDDLTTHTVTVAANTSWENTAELSVEKLGLKASLSSKLTYQHEVSYDTSLPGGHDYVASLYREFPAYLWQVDG